MKPLFLLFISLLSANYASAQTPILAKAENDLFPFYENGKVGYFYKKTKKVAIKAQKFDYGLPFSDNLALVREGEMLYFIRKNGKKAFDMPYQFAESFKSGKSVVFDGEKHGVINTKGAIVLPLVYDHIFYYEDAKVFAVKQGEKHFFVNEKNQRADTMTYEEIIPLENSNFYRIKKGGKYGVLDKNMGIILPCIYNGMWRKFEDYPIRLSVENIEGKPNQLTPEGEFITYEALIKRKTNLPDPNEVKRYEHYNEKQQERHFLRTNNGRIIGDSSIFQTLQQNGRYYISHQRKNGKHLWGILAADGSLEIKPQYDSLILYDRQGQANTSFMAFKDFKMSCIDMNNIPILPFSAFMVPMGGNHEQKNYFELAYRTDILLKRNIGIANNLGKTIVSPQYPLFATAGDNLKGCYLFKQDKNFILADKKSKITLFKNYDNLHILTDSCFIVEKDNLFGLVDYKNMITIPIVYTNILLAPNNDNFFIKDKNQKYGMMDRYGVVLIPCIYDNIEPYYGGFVKVQQGGKWGTFDYKGNVILQCDYDSIGDAWCISRGHFRYSMGGCCGTGLPIGHGSVVFFTKNNKKGALNPNDGSVILPAVYDNISLFPYATGYVIRDSLCGIVTLQGKWLLPIAYKFKHIYHIIPNSYRIYEPYGQPDNQSVAWFQGKWGVMDKDLKTIIPFEYDDISWVNGSYHAKKGEQTIFFDEKGQRIFKE
jgi:WG containing repeat